MICATSEAPDEINTKGLTHVGFEFMGSAQLQWRIYTNFGSLPIGGSKGAPGTPAGPNSFIFVQFSANKILI